MCIFCKIVNKEIPSKIIYEDDDFLSFLDLSQATKGHSLLIPKKHFDNILESNNDTLSSILPIAKNISIKLVKTFDAKGINILTNCGIEAGQTINHFHIHLIPRYENDDLEINFKEHSFNLDELITELK